MEAKKVTCSLCHSVQVLRVAQLQLAMSTYHPETPSVIPGHRPVIQHVSHTTAEAEPMCGSTRDS